MLFTPCDSFEICSLCKAFLPSEARLQARLCRSTAAADGRDRAGVALARPVGPVPMGGPFLAVPLLSRLCPPRRLVTSRQIFVRRCQWYAWAGERLTERGHTRRTFRRAAGKPQGCVRRAVIGIGHRHKVRAAIRWAMAAWRVLGFYLPLSMDVTYLALLEIVDQRESSLVPRTAATLIAIIGLL